MRLMSTVRALALETHTGASSSLFLCVADPACLAFAERCPIDDIDPFTDRELADLADAIGRPVCCDRCGRDLAIPQTQRRTE